MPEDLRVGTIITLADGRRTIVMVDNPVNGCSCSACMFGPEYPECGNWICSNAERADRTNVHFKLLGNSTTIDRRTFATPPILPPTTYSNLTQVRFRNVDERNTGW